MNKFHTLLFPNLTITEVSTLYLKNELELMTTYFDRHYCIFHVCIPLASQAIPSPTSHYLLLGCFFYAFYVASQILSIKFRRLIVLDKICYFKSYICYSIVTCK